MRVLVAPDSFGGSLTAAEAADAIAAGWRRGAPQDDVDLVPLSDGGPGFVDALAGASGGRLVEVAARDPWLRPVGGRILLDGTTAYVESAQACGLHLVETEKRQPALETTTGVADLLSGAIGAGATKVVVGLGGSATNDGGAGLLNERGVQLRDASGRELPPVPRSLARLDHVALRPSWRLPAELVAATDVDNPLLGHEGATAVYGPQKGVQPADIDALDAALARFADVLSRQLPGASGLERSAGAGAAGGLGYGLFVLGARRQSGIELVLGATHLAERIERADLVITGEGSFDSQSERGKVVAGVACMASSHATACIVLAGRIAKATAGLHQLPIAAAYSVSEAAGSEAASLAEPGRHLAALAEHVARSNRV